MVGNTKFLVVQVGEVRVQGFVDHAEPKVVVFTKLNDSPISHVTVNDQALLFAESQLRLDGYSSFLVGFEGEDPVEFPSVESLASLPKIDTDMVLLYEADRYDGPISGLVEHAGSRQIFWFDWCTESGHGNGSRVYSLRPVPQETVPQLRCRIKTHNDLSAELHLLELVQQWPVSDRQRSSLRNSVQIQAELDRNQDLLPDSKLRSEVITAWMPDCMEELAAIKIVWMSKEHSARLENWQKAVALALRSESEQELELLFREPAELLTELDLFKVNVPNSDGTSRIIARNHLGQNIGETFWLTANHRIHDFTHLADRA